MPAAAPRPRASIDFFKAKGLTEIPTFGPLSWSVPGCVDGWDQLRKRFGTRPWPELLAPAIDYAEDGLSRQRDHRRRLARRPRTALRRFPPRPTVTFPAATHPAQGDVFRNPGLARSLRTIAQDGRDAFYRGPLAEAIVKYSQSAGGLFSLVGFRRAHQQLSRSGLDQLPRLSTSGSFRPTARGSPCSRCSICSSHMT